MTSMKERISNVIAWIGFVSILALGSAYSVNFWYESLEKPKLLFSTSCEVFDTAEWVLENPEASAVAKEHISEARLRRCKSNSKAIAMWSYEGDFVVVTGFMFQVGSLMDVDHLFDGFTYVDTDNLVYGLGPIAIPIGLTSIILNYILFGSARLLPWRKAVINEEAS